MRRAAVGLELHDEAGEVASDPITDPVAFARAYADAWHAAEPARRQTLARHNVKALAQAAKVAAARAVLDALSPEEAGEAAQPAPSRNEAGPKDGPARPTPAAQPSEAKDAKPADAKPSDTKPSEATARRSGSRATA